MTNHDLSNLRDRIVQLIKATSSFYATTDKNILFRKFTVEVIQYVIDNLPMVLLTTPAGYTINGFFIQPNGTVIFDAFTNNGECDVRLNNGKWSDEIIYEYDFLGGENYIFLVHRTSQAPEFNTLKLFEEYLYDH